MGSSAATLERVRALGLCLDDVVVTGASIGLPSAESDGESRAFATPDDFERIFNGISGISRLPDEDISLMLEKNVVQMRRNETGGREKYRLSSPEEVIRIAGRIADFDLSSQHNISKALLPALDITFKMAIATGLEAIRTAQIPLMPSDGGKLLLPEDMQDSTGIIFAASFPVLDSLIEEISSFLHKKFEKQNFDDKLNLMNSIAKMLSVKFPESTEILDKLVRDAGAESNGGVLSYEFNRKLLFQILVMANSQLAELIGARGPNVDLNAACASSAMAIALAEDWIRVGRASRVIVVAADNVTSRNMLQYVGTGFLALGAASTKGTPEEAALPFSRNRNGLILGSGAVGMVLEAKQAAIRRNATVLSRLLATKVVNSAYHGSAIDARHVEEELDKLLDHVENLHGVTREDIARRGIYVSHETFTCANGGCAAVEVNALRGSLGPSLASELLIANTKAYTGHPMGAGLEDAVAVMALHQGRVPPIPNVADIDERLGKLNLSRGGEHEKQFALRFAAGFGSQCVYIVYAKE